RSGAQFTDRGGERRRRLAPELALSSRQVAADRALGKGRTRQAVGVARCSWKRCDSLSPQPWLLELPQGQVAQRRMDALPVVYVLEGARAAKNQSVWGDRAARRDGGRSSQPPPFHQHASHRDRESRSIIPRAVVGCLPGVSPVCTTWLPASKE